MIKKLLINEKGQSLVMVAIFLTVLIGFAGLAIDGGKLYLAKSKLQKAADAGVLGGADYLLDLMKQRQVDEADFIEAGNKAKFISEENSPLNGPIDDNKYEAYKNGANYVKVTRVENVDLMLMPILGNDSITEVKAEARVKIGDVKKVGLGQVIPIGIHLDEELEFGVELNLTYGPGTTPSPGWYGYLDFSDSDVDPNKSNQGTAKLADYINTGSPSDFPTGTFIDIREGKPTEANKVDEAIEARDGQIVYVPIVGPVKDGEVEVLGFAQVRLIYDPDSKVIKATFISKELPEEIGDTAEYGIYDSKLEL
jgi:hypothetical protein